MCLYKKHILPKKTKQDIVVYKLVLFVNSKYISPYQNTPIDIHEHQIPYDHCSRNLISSIFKRNLKKGFIHSFTDYDMAIRTKSELYILFNSFYGCFTGSTSVRPKIPYLFKCVIPKGTFYYEGKDGDIASRKLIYEEKI